MDTQKHIAMVLGKKRIPLGESMVLCESLDVGSVLTHFWNKCMENTSLFRSEYEEAKKLSMEQMRRNLEEVGAALGMTEGDLAPDMKLLGESLDEGWLSDKWGEFVAKVKGLSWFEVTGYSFVAIIYAVVSVGCYWLFKTPLSQMSPLLRQILLDPAQEVLYTVGSPEQIAALRTLLRINIAVIWGTMSGLATGLLALVYVVKRKYFPSH